jgi:hypothetical protein
MAGHSVTIINAVDLVLAIGARAQDSPRMSAAAGSRVNTACQTRSCVYSVDLAAVAEPCCATGMTNE